MDNNNNIIIINKNNCDNDNTIFIQDITWSGDECETFIQISQQHNVII